MADPFAQREAQYRELSRRYEAEELDADQFAEQLAALQFQDEQEHWWQIAANGKWLRYAGEDWQPAAPPKRAPPPPPRDVLLPSRRRKSTGRKVTASAPAEEPVEDIFAGTGVAAEEIPGLLHPEPAAAEFLLTLDASPGEPAKPLPVQVRKRPAPPPPAHPPASQRSASSGKTPTAAQPPHAGDKPQKHRSAKTKAKDGPAAAKAPPEADKPQQTIKAPPQTGPAQCSKCKAQLRPGGSFCAKCGQAVATTVAPPSAGEVCPKCHKTSPAGARFCKNCGQPLR